MTTFLLTLGSPTSTTSFDSSSIPLTMETSSVSISLPFSYFIPSGRGSSRGISSSSRPRSLRLTSIKLLFFSISAISVLIFLKAFLFVYLSSIILAVSTASLNLPTSASS
ncbi:109aa long hypothetical protein [Pyrococcus horikoshii OT3]|uniref:Uncharacterized protein n=1 Tax=Pyrococcus horikoshii (strain ATCC 700860 / DSM 12428 / JCM 9974 / NBRC 100139 / OT-3) TaxID=70601 RepID=O58319_PYRHO|nr:109aa long hypothetical protein [Pyrococcus horikoshii OT3]